MRGSTLPVKVFTNNRAVTRLFQTKIVPPALRNACDYFLQYSLVIAHVAGAMNATADFLSRTDINPMETCELNNRSDIQRLSNIIFNTLA